MPERETAAWEVGRIANVPVFDDLAVLGYCVHGVDLDRDFCSEGCRV